MANNKEAKEAANLIFFMFSFIIEAVVLIVRYFKGVCEE
jgi:hypothetical protein